MEKGHGGMWQKWSPFDSLDQSGVNGVADGVDRGGALGLSHNKMALVREKKEKIEKVITKCLILQYQAYMLKITSVFCIFLFIHYL